MPDKRILMGVIGRPHGVRGLVRVHSYAEADLSAYSPLIDEQGRAWSLVWRSEGIAELRDASGAALPDRTAAERLVNLKLYVERERLPAPATDDFYLSDLVGLAAVTAEGAALGRVVQVHDYGAGASLEIAGEGAPLLVPFTKAAVPNVDLVARQLVVVRPDEIEVSLPPGEGGGEGLDAGADDGRRAPSSHPSRQGRGSDRVSEASA